MLVIAQSAPAPALPAANSESFIIGRAHLFEVSYALRNGARGTMNIISRSRAGAIGRVANTYGEQLRAASARVLS